MTYEPFSVLSQFVFFEDATHTFIFKPTLFSQLGTHMISVRITDFNGDSVS